MIQIMTNAKLMWGLFLLLGLSEGFSALRLPSLKVAQSRDVRLNLKKIRTRSSTTFSTLVENQSKPRLQSQLESDDTIVIADFNNNRGKDNFKKSSAEFFRVLSAWGKMLRGGQPRVLCVVDHGLAPSATTFNGIGVLFAGPNRTADDVIASVTR